MEYIISLAVSVGGAMLIFLWQSAIKENKALKKDRRQESKKHEEALENGVLCLLRAELIKDHEKHMALGHISPAAYENGMAMYAAYKALGGNGLVEHMKDEIEELNLKTKRGR